MLSTEASSFFTVSKSIDKSRPAAGAGLAGAGRSSIGGLGGLKQSSIIVTMKEKIDYMLFMQNTYIGRSSVMT